MSKKIKSVFGVIGQHFLNVFISILVVTILGGFFAKADWLLSIFTTLIYVAVMYSAGWRKSGREFRLARANYKQGKLDKMDYRRYDGFILPVGLVILSAVLYVCALVFDDLAFVIHRAYNFPFLFIFDKVKTPYVFEIFVIILPVICYGVGYVLGKNSKTIVTQHIDKLVYKPKDNK